MNKKQLTLCLALPTTLTLVAFYAPTSAAPCDGVILNVPVTISTPGVYCLNGTVLAGAGEFGIEILSPGVTIDLQGHSLIGPGAGQVTSGIYGLQNGTTVRNGNIEGWGAGAVNLGDFAQVEDLHFQGNGTNALRVGAGGAVRDCRFVDNLDRELTTGPDSLVESCRIKSNQNSDSVVVGECSVVRDVSVDGGFVAYTGGFRTHFMNCSARGFGSVAFNVGQGGTASRCTATTMKPEAENGIVAGTGSKLSDCDVEGSMHTGVTLRSGASIRNSSIRNTPGIGIFANNGAEVLQCNIIGCNTELSDTGGGIVTNGDLLLLDSTLSRNFVAGLAVRDSGGLIDGCRILNNMGAGMVLGDSVIARNNQVFENQGTGIQVDGAGLLIRDNVVDDNANGIVVNGRRSLIIHNRCTNNAGDDYDIPWGNPTGPIVESTWQIGGSIPQANFETN